MEALECKLHKVQERIINAYSDAEGAFTFRKRQVLIF